MIRLGDTIRLKQGFVTETGTCKQLMLLKWSDFEKIEHKHKYLVVGVVFDDRGFSRGINFLKESTLSDCRKHIEKLIKDEEMLIDA